MSGATAVWRSGERVPCRAEQEAGQVRAAPEPRRRLQKARAGAGGLALAFALTLGPGAHGEGPDPTYWLQFGKTARLCPGSKDDSPSKIEGATWGILASGVILCRDTGPSYAITVDYLNVAIDPAERTLIKRDVVAFDWLGLALYRPGGAGAIDWLFDHSVPVKGELRRDASGRIVFGHITFTVPKGPPEQATNMLFYLTFDGPLVALHVL
jgi:hypothetical protein